MSGSPGAAGGVRPHGPDDGRATSAPRLAALVPVIGRASRVVDDTADAYIPWKVAGRENPELLRAFLRRVRSSAAWEHVYERDGVHVSRRPSGITP